MFGGVVVLLLGTMLRSKQKQIDIDIPLASITSDSRITAIAGNEGQIIIGTESGRVGICEAPKYSLGILTRAHNDRVTAACIAPNGRLAATAGADGTIRIVEQDGMRERLRIPISGTFINSLAFSNDAQYLASASDDGVVMVVDIDRPASRWSFELGNMTPVRASDVRIINARDGKGTLMAVASSDGVLRVWSIETRQEVYRVNVGVPIRTIAFIPMTSRILCGGGSEIQQLKGSYTGESLKRVGVQGTELRLWDLAEKHEVARFSSHEDLIGRVAVRKDGLVAVSCGTWDRRVSFWNVQQQRLIKTVIADPSAVFYVDFVDSNGTVASLGWDGTVRIWRSPSEE